MPDDFKKINKYCECCNTKLTLNNTRDIKRKRFCSRSCSSRMTKHGGNKHSKNTKKKMSLAKQGIYFGKNNPNWQGGKIGYYANIAKRTVKRLIGIIIKNPMCVHHIDGNITNNKANNLLVCTRSYHTSLHRKLEHTYGKKWREVICNSTKI